MQRGFTFFSTVTPSGVWGVEEEEEGEDSQKGALKKTGRLAGRQEAGSEVL